MSFFQSSIIEHKAFKELDDIHSLVDCSDLFRRFVGLDIQAAVPDYTTIWKY